MTEDISIFRIPPPAPDAIEGKQPATSARSKPLESGQNFQETLMRTLGSLSEETDQIARGAVPSFTEVQQAMDAAKMAFHDTMQAHQMMQQFIRESGETKGDADGRSSGKEW